MAYGTQERLSHCAAEWLDAHRFFNNDPTTSNETTTITMHLSQAADPGTLQLQFELTDTDGLHQAQLIVPTAASDPAQGIKLHSCRSLNAKNHTVEFLMTDANLLLDSEVTLQVIDATGNITKQAFSLVLAEDDTVVLASPALEFSAMQAPTETALLPNYPNPFNPETWIPYQLAAPCKVTIEIHAIDGSLVRVLSLGHKATGIYQNRTRAAYWDGRNNIGEPVASGVYLYTITAGEFNATRKMMIRK
ncbi:T9SS type A sorting domain-containing protein [Candidatus Poribacteria bacterium]|nr:T9SS type A sorting domain-containing protein [Candidatus Poribacteria bacterium]